MKKASVSHILQLSVICSLLSWVANGSPVALPEAGAVTNISPFGHYPAWCSDSRRIAFCDVGNNGTNSGIWVYDRTTGETRRTHDSGHFPAFSPKDDRIAFRKNPNLWLIRPDGTEAIDTGIVVGSDIRWSPDGRYLTAHDQAFAPHDQVLLFDTTTWGRTGLEFARIGSRRKVGDCSWTPEGNLIFTPPVGETGDWKPNEVREYTPAGKLIRRTPLHDFPARPFAANISLDGKFILFDRGSRGIWVASRDGAKVRHILPVGAAAVWSPDGRTIAYDDSSSSGTVRNGIFLLDLKL